MHTRRCYYGAYLSLLNFNLTKTFQIVRLRKKKFKILRKISIGSRIQLNIPLNMLYYSEENIIKGYFIFYAMPC